MITVHRRYVFSASHRLHVPAFSEEANQNLFGKCNNPYGHGHNYELEVSVRGPIDAATGRVVGLPEMDDLVRREVLAHYDHRYLNEELPEFASTVPTTENVARDITRRLSEAWTATGSRAQLHSIRIFETARNIFECAL